MRWLSSSPCRSTDDSGTIPVFVVRQRSAFVAERLPSSEPFCMSKRSYSNQRSCPTVVRDSGALRRSAMFLPCRAAAGGVRRAPRRARPRRRARRPSRRSTTATTAASWRSAATCSARAEEAEDARPAHLHGRLPRPRAPTSREIQLRPWLYAIARNRCLSMLRARRERAARRRSRAPPRSTSRPRSQRREDLRDLLGDVARAARGPARRARAGRARAPSPTTRSRECSACRGRR